MSKKLVSLLMAVCLCVSLVVVPVKADAGKYEGVITALRSIEPFKSDFGFDGVEFSEIEIGDEIKVYNYENGSFVENMIAFPLFYEDDLISVMYNVGEEHYQPMPGLHTLIAEVGCDTIAIVYDKVGCHAYDGSSFTLILQAEVEIETREVLTEEIAVGQNEIEMTDLSNRYDLEYSSNVTSYGISPRTEHPNEYAYLGVSYVTQGNYNDLCWAASVACVVNYTKGKNYSAEQIATRKYGAVQDTRLDTDLVAIELRKDDDRYEFVDEIPSTARIRLNLHNNFPVYVKFEFWDISHAGVVFGYSGSDSFYVMDPKQGPVLAYVDDYDRITYCMPGSIYHISAYRGIAAKMSELTLTGTD